MELNEVFAARYSVRAYEKREVEAEKIARILEAGRIAPTAKNLQPVRVLTVTDKMDKLALATKCTFGAPLAFILCQKGECYERFYDGKRSADVDAGIVETYMMLAAVNEGLGTCWVMAFDPAVVKREFPEIGDAVPLSVLVAGYPSERACPSERHELRLSLQEFSI